MPGLLKIDVEKFDTKYDCAGVDEFRSLLKDDITSEWYGLFPAILYPKDDTRKKKVFRNPILPLVSVYLSFSLHMQLILPPIATSSVVIWSDISARWKICTITKDQ